MMPSGAARRLIRHYQLFLRDLLRDLFDAKVGRYAASLSWSTLFALVPMLAIAAAIFSRMPAFARMKMAFERLMEDNLPVSDPAWVMGRIEAYTANAGQLGWIGAAYALIAAVLFVRTYDYIVNDICEAPRRSALSALRAYGGLALAIPLLSAVSYWLGGVTDAALAARGWPLRDFTGGSISFLRIWAIVFLLYQFTPNRKMSPAAAVSSAFIATAVWWASKYLFVLYVAHNRTYATIYGSVAAVLFFLLWIHISWVIHLHGLKFCTLLERERRKG